MRPKSKQNQSPVSISTTDPPNDFAFKITKIAVSQICQSVGFKSSQTSALETLTQIATLYLKTIAKTAASYSNAASRTQSNLFDIIDALHDLFSIQGGFAGASTLHSRNNLLNSNAVKDLCVFVNSSDETPFAKPIPIVNSIPIPSVHPNLELKSKSRGMHIPKWLPEFPEERTYKKCEEDMKKKREKRIERKLGLWENSELVRIGNEFEKKNEIGSCGCGDLAMDRERVRFKIKQR